MEWKWSYGPPYEKSGRRAGKPHNDNNNIYNNDTNTDNININKTIALSAQNQSLLSENDIWRLDVPVTDFIRTNKREETYNKMSERELVCQTGQNPFLTNNNYVEDILSHEQFMKPANTYTNDK
jgi:hypothetical protein